MLHRHGPEVLFYGINPTQRIINHNSYGYSNHLLDFIICYPTVIVTSQYTLPDYLALAIQLSGKIRVSVYTIIFVVALQWNSFNHGVRIKLDLGYDGLLRCE